MEESLPIGHTRKSVSTWVDVVKIPTIKQGQLFEDNKKFTITSEWCVDNLASKEVQTFSKCFTLLKPSGNDSVTALFETSDHVLIQSSPTPIERL